MTNQDDQAFLVLMQAMAAALRAELDDPTIELYFRGLQDIPYELVAEAGERLLVGARFFPRIAEWRASVDLVIEDRQRQKRALQGRQQPLLPGEVGEGKCPTCDDTGWELFEKPCEKRLMCPSANGHEDHAHTWSRRCETCREKRAARREEEKRYSRTPYREDD